MTMRTDGKLMVFLLAAVFASGSTLAVAQTIHDVILEDIDGNQFRIGECFSKGPVIVTFWASWWNASRIALPQLQKIYSSYREDGLAIVSISINTAAEREKARAFAQRLGVSFPVLLDPEQKVAKAFNPGNSFPMTYVFAADGTMLVKFSGFQPGDERELESLVRQLLGK